jgi:hypothetical protein
MASPRAARQAPGEASGLGAGNEDIRPVPSHRTRRALAVIATVLVFALVTAGCGRRDLPAEAGIDAAAATQAAPSTGPTTRPTTRPTAEASVPPPSAAAAEPPVTTEPPVASLPPLATPDLAAIEDLLKELDAALGADATADTDEGSPR